MAVKRSKLPGHPVWHFLARLTKILMANPALHTVDQVPDMFKEVYILSGYRSPQSSPWECILSVFERNNETFNFWTHFLPSLYFWWRTVILWPSLVSQGTYAYPMMACFVSIATFPIMSAVAHIFNTMSDRARHICFFMDYAAIGFYVLGAAIGYRAYVFPFFLLNSWFSSIYLQVATVLSVAAFISACYSRFLPSGLYKKALRMSGFGIPYFFVSTPLMLRILQCEGAECRWSALLSIKTHFFMAFLSAFLFASHMPERLYPGRFDIVGHSHQLFHLFSVLASHFQMNALLQDMEERRELMLGLGALPPPETSLQLLGVVLILSLLVLAYFIHKLKYLIPKEEEEEEEEDTGKEAPQYEEAKSLFNNNIAKPRLRHRDLE